MSFGNFHATVDCDALMLPLLPIWDDPPTSLAHTGVEFAFSRPNGVQKYHWLALLPHQNPSCSCTDWTGQLSRVD